MTRRVQLSEEAYERLAARKREDETFSDVVLRLTGASPSPEGARTLDDETAEALRDAVEERRARRREELERIADTLEE